MAGPNTKQANKMLGPLNLDALRPRFVDQTVFLTIKNTRGTPTCFKLPMSRVPRWYWMRALHDKHINLKYATDEQRSFVNYLEHLRNTDLCVVGGHGWPVSHRIKMDNNLPSYAAYNTITLI